MALEEFSHRQFELWAHWGCPSTHFSQLSQTRKFHTHQSVFFFVFQRMQWIGVVLVLSSWLANVSKTIHVLPSSVVFKLKVDVERSELCLGWDWLEGGWLSAFFLPSTVPRSCAVLLEWSIWLQSFSWCFFHCHFLQSLFIQWATVLCLMFAIDWLAIVGRTVAWLLWTQWIHSQSHVVVKMWLAVKEHYKFSGWGKSKGGCCTTGFLQQFLPNMHPC